MESPVHPPLPVVSAGVMLGFPCPSCGNFSSKYMTACGCYACTVCHYHVPIPEFAAACHFTTYLVNHPASQ